MFMFFKATSKMVRLYYLYFIMFGQMFVLTSRVYMSPSLHIAIYLVKSASAIWYP